MNIINEWTQTYLGNNIMRDPDSNSLRELVVSLNTNGRQANVIYSILRGMGITEALALHAISNYITPQPTELLRVQSIQGTKNNINTIMTENFNLKKLLEYVKELKENVISLAQENNTNINYSAKQVMTLCETYEIKIGNVSALLEELDAAKGDAMKETRLRYRLNENDLQGLSQFRYLSEMVSQLQKFKYLSPISTFIQEAAVVLEENKYQVLSANALYNMKNDKNSAFYESAIDDLKYLIQKGEDGIKSKLRIIMEKHKWINHVSSMIKDYSVYEQVSISNSEGTVKRIYSPVQINEDKSIIFSLSGNYLQLKGKEVTAVDNMSIIEQSFFNTQRALANFKIIGEKLMLFNNKNTIEINTNSKEILINDVVIESDISAIRNRLINTNFFGINEMYKIDELMYLLEGIDTLSELDFVTSISSNTKAGVVVNVIKVDENNVYINRINSMMKVNELFKVTDVNEAQEKVSEFIKFDISKEIIEMLDDNKQELIKLEEEKTSLIDKLNYLEEKKSELETALLLVGESAELKSALDLIKSEIRDKEVDLQETYIKIGKPISESTKLKDKGYIRANIINKIGSLYKGANVYVYAEDFTTKGDDEEVRILKAENDSHPIFVLKKNVKIK